MAGGTVKCWGSNRSRGLGLLGEDFNYQTSEPVDVPGLSGMRAIRASSIAAGMCAIGNDNRVTCWGIPFNGVRVPGRRRRGAATRVRALGE
jgi:alpha-tubulin suppressor-like RCC1 family protein